MCSNFAHRHIKVTVRSSNSWVATVLVDARDLAGVLTEAGHGRPYPG
jgi:hypothetical protein